ncbi:hypothetical protein Tco_0982031 [Tanacetum coccineum]
MIQGSGRLKDGDSHFYRESSERNPCISNERPNLKETFNLPPYYVEDVLTHPEENVLTHPEENVVAQLLTDEENYMKAVIGI